MCLAKTCIPARVFKHRRGQTAPCRCSAAAGSKTARTTAQLGAPGMNERFREIALEVNGEKVSERVDARTTLVDFLRERLALTGSHVGRGQGVWGGRSRRGDVA